MEDLYLPNETSEETKSSEKKEEDVYPEPDNTIQVKLREMLMKKKEEEKTEKKEDDKQ